MTPSATTTLYAQPPQSRSRRRLTIAVGPAAVVNRREARCPTSFSGEKPSFVYGVDTFQAVALAVRYVSMRLERMTADGWRFFCTRNHPTPLHVVAVWGQRSPLWPAPPSWSDDGSRRRAAESRKVVSTATDVALRTIGGMRLDERGTRSRITRDALSELRSSVQRAGVNISVSGSAKGVPYGGTSVSPTIAMESAGKPLVAVELVFAKSEQQLSEAVCRALGRALVYRVVYPCVVISVLGAARPHEVPDEEVARRLAEVSIFPGFKRAVRGEDDAPGQRRQSTRRR